MPFNRPPLAWKLAPSRLCRRNYQMFVNSRMHISLATILGSNSKVLRNRGI
jgi:hypothetical protein